MTKALCACILYNTIAQLKGTGGWLEARPQGRGAKAREEGDLRLLGAHLKPQATGHRDAESVMKFIEVGH